MSDMIYILLNNPGGKEKVGDCNNARGIAASLTSDSSKIEEIQISQIEEAFNYAKNNQDLSVTLIAAGEELFGYLSSSVLVENKPTNLKIIYSAHQPPKNLLHSHHKFDLIALPAHVVSTEIANILGNKLCQTIGVAHNLKKQNLIEKNSEGQIYQNDFSQKRLLLVILAGDIYASTPNSEGELPLLSQYTIAEAENLAKYISNNHPDHYVLVTNGPRTGKASSSGETHKSESQLDSITQRFIDIIKERRGDNSFYLANFTFCRESEYKDLLSLMLKNKNPDSRIYVPGESVSMISEALSLLPHNQITIYNNSATLALDSSEKSSLFARMNVLPDTKFYEYLYKIFRSDKPLIEYKDLNGFVDYINEKGPNLLPQYIAENDPFSFADISPYINFLKLVATNFNITLLNNDLSPVMLYAENTKTIIADAAEQIADYFHKALEQSIIKLREQHQSQITTSELETTERFVDHSNCNAVTSESPSIN